MGIEFIAQTHPISPTNSTMYYRYPTKPNPINPINFSNFFFKFFEFFLFKMSTRNNREASYAVEYATTDRCKCRLCGINIGKSVLKLGQIIAPEIGDDAAKKMCKNFGIKLDQNLKNLLEHYNAQYYRNNSGIY